ncbi:MAG TPA: shikimate kinase [Candidatus Atribacteria bacterium]|nr:shikimate kinase [Candidatus Atribacteria bacterium]
MRKNIIITGFMGTGKSVTAKELAQRLEMEFIDMDRVIEERQGASIADIFDRYGEKYFREQENILVRELSLQENLVIATGGGTFLNLDNIKTMNQEGKVICLYATPQALYSRLEKKNNRPLIKGDNLLNKINHLLERRKKIYESFDYKINTSNLSVQEVVDKIVTLLKLER